MPSSVLLAILVGAGVLALMPALVRRYDAVVRGQAELHTSSMRVLLRRRRRRTVPGSAPINPPSFLGARNPARAMGRADAGGTLEAGKLADLIVQDANPLADIANARRIRLVMKGGALYGRAELLPRR